MIFKIFLIFLLSFGGSWIWGLYRGIPVPYGHDEFTYLLGADTFAHGRITNPPHPMWQHFDTFYILQQPTYTSKYPPAQSLFLALGKVFFGHAIYGVWLSAGLMCAAIYWMLYAWLPPRWALIGGLVSVLQFGIFTYWSQSYWGGAVAALGGALVFGAWPRLREGRIRDALWMGMGCILLAHSRPLEGFLVAIPVVIMVLPWRRWGLVLSKKVWLTLVLLLLMNMAATAYYNKEITGNAKLSPYILYTQNSLNVPLFIWQPLGHHVKFLDRSVQGYEQGFLENYYLSKKTLKGFMQDMRYDTMWVVEFFLGYPLALPAWIMMGFFFLRRPWSWKVWLTLAILFIALAVGVSPGKAHYFAPLTCVAVWLVVRGLRYLSALKIRNRRMGTRWVAMLLVFQLFFNLFLTPIIPVTSLAKASSPESVKLPAFFSRQQLHDILLKTGRRYLIVVKYPVEHNNAWEWVYNSADIDHAPIVWAHDMGLIKNKELLEYFKDRQVIYIQTIWDLPGFVDYHARQ